LRLIESSKVSNVPAADLFQGRAQFLTQNVDDVMCAAAVKRGDAKHESAPKQDKLRPSCQQPGNIQAGPNTTVSNNRHLVARNVADRTDNIWSSWRGIELSSPMVGQYEGIDANLSA
jgi:hypothetical protein